MTFEVVIGIFFMLNSLIISYSNVRRTLKVPRTYAIMKN